jgi:hypothetical protein
MKRTLAIAAMVAGMASVAGAQIIRPVSVVRHTAFTSLSVGWLQMDQPICDPNDNACWSFGDGPQYRASFELPMGPAATIGVSYSNAQLPLRWADTPPNTANCTVCDANAEMNQIMGVVHLGSSGTFQQVIDLSVGATQFGNFKTTSGTPLGTGKRATDFSFSVAYGFGYSINRSLLLTFQQEFGLVVHQRVSGSAHNSAQQQVLRLGLRLGM